MPELGTGGLSNISTPSGQSVGRRILMTVNRVETVEDSAGDGARPHLLPTRGYPKGQSDNGLASLLTDITGERPGRYACPELERADGGPTRISDYQPLIGIRMEDLLVADGDFIDIYRHILASPGKRIRSAMALACSRLVPATESVTLLAALDLACGMEMLHESSLIHDDICDGSVLRRSRPSVPATFGIRTAARAGFHMAGTAMRAVSQVLADYPRVFASLGDAEGVTYLNRLSELSLGQLVETMPPILDDAAMRRHYEVVAKAKTGTLFRLCCSYGGTAGAVDSDRLRSLMVYADELALAFQIMDDVRDIEGGPGLGKDACGDLDRRVVTWPVIEWLATTPAAHGMWQSDATPSADLQAGLMRSGATDTARQAAVAAAGKASHALSVFPPTQARDYLDNLLTAVVAR